MRDIWPFPTIEVSDGSYLDINNLVLKLIEICIMMFYCVELMPKILIWKKPVWWKAINAVLVTLMVL